MRRIGVVAGVLVIATVLGGCANESTPTPTPRETKSLATAPDGSFSAEDFQLKHPGQRTVEVTRGPLSTRRGKPTATFYTVGEYRFFTYTPARFSTDPTSADYIGQVLLDDLMLDLPLEPIQFKGNPAAQGTDQGVDTTHVLIVWHEGRVHVFSVKARDPQVAVDLFNTIEFVPSADA